MSIYNATLAHCYTHIHDTSRTVYICLYMETVSVDPVPAILLSINGAAKIDNRPNNPIS